MLTVKLPLADIIIDIDNQPDFKTLLEAEIIARLKDAYAFLGEEPEVTVTGDTAVLQFNIQSQESKRTQKLFDKATNEASRGRYSQAIKFFEAVLQHQPDNVAAHRNLGMAYLEIGEVEEGRTHVLHALRLNPHDAYSLLLMGNIYFQHKEDLLTAERLFQAAAEQSPDDPYILSNYASTLAKRGEYETATEYFHKALAADAGYPNAGFGLALVHYQQQQYRETIETLDKLFEQPETADIRTEHVYQEIWRLYRNGNQELAQAESERFLAQVRQLREEIEKDTDVEIELVADPAINANAKAEIAWHHGRSRHVVRYKELDPAITPHFLAHELEHIVLETEARQADNNRFFITNDFTRKAAQDAILSDVSLLKRSGALGNMLDTFIERIISGLTNQLFNLPLDMVIEHRLYTTCPELRPTQFVSLAHTHKENLAVLNDSQIKQITPRLIYNANLAMNAAYALFMDHLLGGVTNYASDYESTRFHATAVSYSLYGWMSKTNCNQVMSMTWWMPSPPNYGCKIGTPGSQTKSCRQKKVGEV
ncbi:MAG: tetratricopeptide repeat protein [Ardenticatenaceae bacterium]|nr:tetratricopeptide repeat protein [Ardenticatenaceae bacterium]